MNIYNVSFTTLKFGHLLSKIVKFYGIIGFMVQLCFL